MHIPFDSADRVLTRLLAGPEAAQRPLWLLCVADGHGELVPALLDGLRAQGVRACGGVFPGLVAGGRRVDTGLLAIPLPAESQVAAGAPEHPCRLPPCPEAEGGPATCLTLVDCRGQGISAWLEVVFDHYGHRVHYVGAGAGHHDLRAAPSVFTEAGFVPGGALLVLIPRGSTVQVRHGWHRAAGPYIATRTRGNVIQELDWEPAADFYRAQVEALSPELAGRPVFPDISAAHPLCIGKEGGEDVLRDPTHTDEHGALGVLSDVPENAVMYLARGDRASLIEAARAAAEACVTADEVTTCLVFDCYSRAFMLGDELRSELSGIDAALATFTAVPAEGVLAVGEIAGNGRHGVDLLNKTIVVALLHGERGGAAS